ncbi:hypothetical protein HYPSUDRAFT_787010 [Hypholoma sublateritium FD-334 SS-4]|uniref:DUF6534 domain-containing protein n=1 Tax=Hypholoma sublateritium (strain FD-334 SS-4) TaxID=945553 RepID=A0A0D2PKT6_HYPSF|nr:hypothetical protein HYPSUDRAFT_787010 [Hypholoma sublateritium FD-334 SS-4]
MGSEDITIANTFGALEIGSSVSAFLFGVVTLQTHVYFSRFPEDRFQFKALVSAVWVLELAHTIAVFYEVYWTTIVMYDNPAAVVAFPSIGVVFVAGGAITAMVQIFFSYRLYKFLPMPYNAAGGVTAVTAFTRFILSTYGGVKTILAPVYADYAFEPSTTRLVLALLIMGAIIDVTIASSMVYFLMKTRGKALARATRLIDRLIGFSLRTGLLTSFAAIAVLIIHRLQPNTMIYLAVYTSLAKLYSNTLLSSLNSRSDLRNAISTSTVSVEVPRRKGTSSRPAYNHNPISIEMKTVTEFRDDNFSV